MSDDTEVHLEWSEGGFATLWLSNPKHLNALSNAMIVGLCDAFTRLASDPNCRAVVLRGRGGIFCAGRELRDVRALQNADLATVRKVYGDMQRMNELIYAAPQPVVCVVEKYGFGIATMIASWSDITIAEENALLGYPEVHHGITPYGAVPTMLNTLSQKATMDLLLTGRRIDAVEAARMGLITRAVPAARLEAELKSVLDSLSQGSPAAIAKSKLFARECEALTYRQGIVAATDKALLGVGMPEVAQGLDAFLARRKANWSPD